MASGRGSGSTPSKNASLRFSTALSPKASTFCVYVAELTKRGLLTTPEPGKVSLTKEGRSIADVPAAATADGLHDMACKLLGPQEVKVFDLIYSAYPNSISRHRIAELMGLSPTASTTGVYVAGVAAFGIVETAGRGEVRAADWLFP